jgi:hypothetical protein
MPLTSFPNGVASFGIPIYGASANAPPLTGTVLFVDTVNGVNAGPGNSPTYPYQTIAYALTQVPSGAYATIYVMPGSTTTISSATALTLNVANVAIVGLGTGAQRPVFAYTTANTAAIPVSAANVTVENFRITANFLSIARAFTVTATGFRLVGCSITDSSNVLNFLAIINCTGAANTANGLAAIGNTWNGLGTTSVTSFIVTANDIDSAVIQGNNILLARTATAAVIMTVTAGVLTNLTAVGNSGVSQQTADTGGAFINVGGTTSTGLVANNYLADLAATDLFMTVSVGVRFFNNYKTGVLGASGYLLPAADS